MNIEYIIGGASLIGLYFLTGIRIIRPTERGLVERLGRYARFAQPGFNWVIPVIDRMRKINITEMMVEAEPQFIITKDKLNAQVDAQIYFQVKTDESSVMASQYNVNNYRYQIVNLARTTLRNIIGTLTLTEANSDRNRINKELMSTLASETANWGIKVVRTELKEIDPPKDVQDTMNQVVKAENTKTAAIDYATAAETKADGERRAEIKRAEAYRQARILEAEGQAQAIKTVADANANAIKLVNEAAEKYFKGNAIEYRKLEVTERTLAQNTKYFIPEKTSLVAVVEGIAGTKVVPIEKKQAE